MFSTPTRPSLRDMSPSFASSCKARRRFASPAHYVSKEKVPYWGLFLKHMCAPCGTMLERFCMMFSNYSKAMASSTDPHTRVKVFLETTRIINSLIASRNAWSWVSFSNTSAVATSSEHACLPASWTVQFDLQPPRNSNFHTERSFVQSNSQISK